MHTVGFRILNKRTQKEYKTEQGALKAIFKWLLKNDEQSVISATLMGPGYAPRVYKDAEELSYLEKKTSSFYSSAKWRTLRYEALETYNNFCKCCGATASDDVTLHVDHIKPRSTHPELELEITNLQILCDACNLGKLNRFQTAW